MAQKIRVGIIGATGMVGQRLVTLLNRHPWFEVVCLAASPRSAGKSYAEAIEGRWQLSTEEPPIELGQLIVYDAARDLKKVANQAQLVFSALDMPKSAIAELEIAYASAGVALVSNNSAHRWTSDVPIIMPEINPGHLSIVEVQRAKRGWTTGLITAKPNCSIQSYVPVLHAWREFGPVAAEITSLQAISGAGKTFSTWPEMVDNVIPFIAGEEEKSEQEPLKVWGGLTPTGIESAGLPQISATCIRVAASDGHMASVAVKFAKKATKEQLVEALQHFVNPIAKFNLPSAPKSLLQYFESDDRPQTKLDRDLERGMAISVGRLRPDALADWKFVSLSHNTLRGAAGGAVLTAELLKALGFV